MTLLLQTSPATSCQSPLLWLSEAHPALQKGTTQNLPLPKSKHCAKSAERHHFTAVRGVVWSAQPRRYQWIWRSCTIRPFISHASARNGVWLDSVRCFGCRCGQFVQIAEQSCARFGLTFAPLERVGP